MRYGNHGASRAIGGAASPDGRFPTGSRRRTRVGSPRPDKSALEEMIEQKCDFVRVLSKP
jgi:hypothetical protein